MQSNAQRRDLVSIFSAVPVMVGHAHTCLKIAWSPTTERAHCVIPVKFIANIYLSVQDNSTDVGLQCNNGRIGYFRDPNILEISEFCKSVETA